MSLSYLQWIRKSDNTVVHGYTNTNQVQPGTVSGGPAANILVSQGLAVNAFNNQAGRGDYFDPSSGTSEGQFLLTLGLLEAYSILNTSTQAQTVINQLLGALPLLYRSAALNPPSSVTASSIFAPHWLFCVKSAFRSATMHYNTSVHFLNGIAVIPDSTLPVRHVFQVASPGFSLVYPSPYSPLTSGTSYAIASSAYDSDTASTTVVLADHSVTGTLAVILSAADGPTIQPKQMYEAWPDWRPLADGEVDAACDTFNWAYRMYSRASTVLGNALYGRAATATAQQASLVYDINDSRDWLKPTIQLQPFSTSGSYSYSSMTPAPAFACDAKGNVTMMIAAGATSGEAQFGVAAIGDTYAVGDSTQVTVGSTIPQTITCFVDVQNQQIYDATKRFSATLHLNGSGLQSFTLTASDFTNLHGAVLLSGSPVFSFGFDDLSTTPHTLTISRVRQLPNRDIQYQGGAIPFTANFLGQPASLISWRGPVYMGYQSPWMLKQLGNETNVATGVQLLADAQAAWTAQSVPKDSGPFCPVFYFERSDATQYGLANTFGWLGPDPNTGWVGYQVRPLAELAELIAACNGSESYYQQAVTVTNKFLTWLDTHWTNAVAGPPTDFLQSGAQTNYQEPHAAALILRTVLLMDQVARPSGILSGSMNAVYASLLNKVYTLYQSLYVTTGTMAGTFCADVVNQSWFGFWHGEILRSLALLYHWAGPAAQTAMQNDAQSWMTGMIDFAARSTTLAVTSTTVLQSGVYVSLEVTLGVSFPQHVSTPVLLQLTSNANQGLNSYTIANLKFYLTGDPQILAMLQSWAPSAGLQISFDGGSTWTTFSRTVGNPADPTTWLTMAGTAVSNVAPDGVLAQNDVATVALRVATPLLPAQFGVISFGLAADFDVF